MRKVKGIRAVLRMMRGGIGKQEKPAFSCDPPLSSRHRKYPKIIHGTLPMQAGCFCDPESERSVAEFGLWIAVVHAT